MKLTKNQKSVADKVEAGKMYTLKEASELVKEITTTKFDASLDIDVRLGVDPRKANQMVRGVVSLPNGTGKVTRVLALCTPDKFCRWCLEEFEYEGETVMMAPASGFYTTPGAGRNQVRMAYVLKKDDLNRALVVLAKALEAYPGRVEDEGL